MGIMGTFIILAGVIIAIYTFYCGVALWMAQHVIAIENGEEPMRDDDGLTILDHMPVSHVDLMKHYYNGARGIIWRVAFICLIGSLGALMANSAWAVYLFGVALGVDCLLFITYEKRRNFLLEASSAERLFDAGQYLALLGAFLLLAWRLIINV